MRELVGVIARLAVGNARQRSTRGLPCPVSACPVGHSSVRCCGIEELTPPGVATGISEEDVWQAVHRLGLDDHLALPSPIPLARVPLNECLLEE
jgi:hypothetical protein